VAKPLEEFERSYNGAGLLVRYARGRVAHFLSRQILTLAGGGVLFVMNGPKIGLWAVSLALLGEAIDCLFLRKVPALLDRGVPLRRLYLFSAITAALQAVTISVCVGLAWFGSTSHAAPLFAIAFLTGAAINGGLIMPYNRSAAFSRLSVYVATVAGLFLNEVMVLGQLDQTFILNAAGTAMLAYMVYSFLEFVNRGFQRNKANTLALIEQSQVLEATNQALVARQKEAQQLALVAKYANDSVILSKKDGRIFWVNDTFTRMTGFTAEDAVGKMPGDLLNGPDTDPATIAEISASVQTGQPFRGEVLNLTKDGRGVWIETNLVPVLGQDGETEMTIAIERDITDAKQVAVELAEAKRAAEDGARAKAEFLATMSHEIRTPMNGVIGMADLLSETKLSRDQKLYSDTIRSSAQALLTIINDILDLSKLDAQKMSLSPVDFDLRSCLQDTVNLLQPQAKLKGLDLELIEASPLPDKVCADDGRIRQVLVNLIGNAVKFTDHGRVTVRLGVEPKQDAFLLTVAVQDTGIGIPQDKLAGVFERFAQADAATTRRFGGTGLGLTISRLLVEAMGGEISVTSEDGLGSCFTVQMMVKAAMGIGNGTSQPLDDSADQQAQLAGMRILVAEDNQVNRLVIRKYLSNVPVTLEFAHDGQQAVEMVRALQPDVVFMDMSMPVMNGIDATRLIRAEKQPQPVIVALTANAFASDKTACLQAGMDGFLTKPVRRAELIDCLVRHCQPKIDPIVG
jgi:PAS domain S-box-containing protein